jgi:hypothetical protein
VPFDFQLNSTRCQTAAQNGNKQPVLCFTQVFSGIFGQKNKFQLNKVAERPNNLQPLQGESGAVLVGKVS